MTRLQGDAGVVTTWSVVVVVACAAMAGLVLDGGAVLRAHSDAFAVAATAARAGAQELSETAAQGGDVVLDPTAAQDAAAAYLAARDATGTVTVTGATLSVTVQTQAELQLLTVLGASTVDVTATASVDALEAPT